MTALGAGMTGRNEAGGSTVEPGATGVLTAVVADDFSAARRLFVDALATSGRFEVVAEAADGRQALEAATRHQPDLAVLDLAMPAVGGLDVIEEINDASPATRIVVVSGFPGRDLEELVVSRGAAAYVRKGPSIKAVLDEIVMAAGALEIAGELLAARQRFPGELGSTRAARRFVTEILERWDCRPAIDTLELILSEVVANSVEHAGSDPEVAVRLLDGLLRVEVSDDSDDLPAMATTTGDGIAVRGRGMRIVDSEASRWGAHRRPGGGKVVWFEVAVFGTGG
ncbi:MAG TPA: response regulator [Acidimicrobiales bacterium]|nr:response regulator [Acidimicrobiales bacterium]